MNIDYNKRWDEQKHSHSHHPSVRFRNRFIISQLKKISFKNLIDVWCGDWYLLSLIKHNFPWTQYSWIDISDSIIAEDKLKYRDISFYQWDVWEKDLNIDNKYNVVVCSEVIEHISDRKQVISNLSEIVDDKGYCILTTQSWKRYKSDINIGHLKHFTLSELENEFKNNWLTIVYSYKRGFPFYDLQKRLYEKIEKRAKKIQHSEVNVLSRLIFNITYILFLLSIRSKILWPQIFMVLQRN